MGFAFEMFGERQRCVSAPPAPSLQPRFSSRREAGPKKPLLLLFCCSVCSRASHLKKKKLKFTFAWGRALFLSSGGDVGCIWFTFFPLCLGFLAKSRKNPQRVAWAPSSSPPCVVQTHRINRGINEFPAQTEPMGARAMGASSGGPLARPPPLRGRGAARPRRRGQPRGARAGREPGDAAR